MPAGSTKLRFISPSSRERCSLPTICHRSHNSSTVSWIFKRATSKPLRPSNGPSRAPIFAPCWQSCNPEQPPLPPDKYVTVIPVQSTKLGGWESDNPESTGARRHSSLFFLIYHMGE